MNTEKPQSTKHSKTTNIAVWAIILLATLACFAWILGSWLYPFDIVASQQMLLSVLVSIPLILFLILRRYRVCAVLVVLLIVSISPIVSNRHLVLPLVDISTKPKNSLRVISLNIHPENESWDLVVQELLAYEADLIVLLEVPAELSRSIKDRGYLDSTPYSHWVRRPWIDNLSSPCYMISRWPIDALPAPLDPAYPDLQLYRRLKLPGGDIAIGLAHPLSPRNSQRWDEGNLMIESQARAVKMINEQFDMPLIVAADLNAGPAQQRARSFRSVGLSMSKPLLRFGGSFPANSPTPSAAMVHLDDVWTLGDIAPIAWDTFEVVGSDHRAVIVDLKIGD
ncbi:MAG: hypothetical protein P1U42_07995 [Phycisphaerales bacterium]|nr:hypothetical protein [Phycisphaerales bacterium]